MLQKVIKDKRILAFLLVMVVILILVSVIKKDESSASWVLFEEEGEECVELVLSVNSGENTVSVNALSFTLTLENEGEQDFSYAESSIVLQKLVNGAWMSWETEEAEQGAQIALETFVPAGDCLVLEISLSDALPYSLRETGSYRVYVPCNYKETETGTRVSVYACLEITLT